MSTPSPDSVPSVIPSDVGNASSGGYHDEVPTLVNAYESQAPTPSHFNTPPLLHVTEMSSAVGYDANGSLHGYHPHGFTYPQPNDSEASSSWHRRATTSGPHDGLHTPGYLQHHDTIHTPFPPSPVQPFTNAFVQNPNNVTLNELSSMGVHGQKLDKAESYAHITPLSSSPALLHAHANGVDSGPITRSSSAATSLELGYPPSYGDSPLSEVPSHYTNGFISHANLPYSDYHNSSNSVSYDDVVDSH